MDIKVIKGDITLMETDAIVNAANSTLLGGGGVDGAIHRAGGRQILEECMEIRERQGGCPVGEAVITSAGKLKANKVIHTVGPIWEDGTRGEAVLLAQCYRNSLKLADDYGLGTIAFPNISTGVYGFPKDKAANIALEVVHGYLPTILFKVVFVCYDHENYHLYTEKVSATG